VRTRRIDASRQYNTSMKAAGVARAGCSGDWVCYIEAVRDNDRLEKVAARVVGSVGPPLLSGSVERQAPAARGNIGKAN
jgi:hypothetical protein